VDRWVRGEPGASDHAPTWIELAASAAPAKKAAAKRKTAKPKPPS
jgi:exodeoxyribonuclease-3